MESIEDKTNNSNFIENMIEHIFISELLQEVWIANNKTMPEILRTEIDDNGYDIVVLYNNKNTIYSVKNIRNHNKYFRTKFEY